MPYGRLPELVALRSSQQGLRIPPGVTVPMTGRVRRLLDTATMRRLARVRQLGLVALVYPGAVHTRFEHSLGVFRLAVEFLARLAHDEQFSMTVTEDDAATFVVAALMHDVGHWPYCHPLEDMGLPQLPRHESLLGGLLAEPGLARILRTDWSLSPDRIAAVIEGTATDPAGTIVASLLSGPIDVDKIDYLSRDSLHAGVPYGQHFDQERLLSSLCLNAPGTALAITAKGRTAAEMLVFARYVMFSEVYWHHAVRAATAMLQRAVWESRDRLDPAALVRSDEDSFVRLLTSAASRPAALLMDGLFGPERRLHKRAATYDAHTHPQLHRLLAGRRYEEMVAVSERLAASLGRALEIDLPPTAILVDAPPAEREVAFNLEVRDRDQWHRLDDLSPVTRSLARDQFDNLVKKVRVFAGPEVVGKIAAYPGLEELLLEAGNAMPVRDEN
jgi:HD superfamily phosphohydrolase